jgi:hypothetical protein
MSSTDDFLELFLKDNPLMSTEFGILSSEPVNSLQTSIPQSTPNLNITNMEKIGTTPPISVEQTQVPTDIENTHQKRTQVPKACSNCRRMHAGCDLGRPCKRCIQNGLESSCIDVPRKKRASRKKTNGKDFSFYPLLTMLSRCRTESTRGLGSCLCRSMGYQSIIHTPNTIYN